MLHQRMQLYTLCVRSAALYGLGRLSSACLRKLQVVEVKHLRALARSSVLLTREPTIALYTRLKLRPPAEQLLSTLTVRQQHAEMEGAEDLRWVLTDEVSASPGTGASSFGHSNSRFRPCAFRPLLLLSPRSAILLVIGYRGSRSKRAGRRSSGESRRRKIVSSQLRYQLMADRKREGARERTAHFLAALQMVVVMTQGPWH